MIVKKENVEAEINHYVTQLQNPGPHQRTLDVAATGCAKYMRNSLNEIVREIIVH